MRLTPDMPEAATARVIDAETGEELTMCLWADDTAGTLEPYVTDAAGRLVVEAGEAKTVVEHRRIRFEFGPRDGATAA